LSARRRSQRRRLLPRGLTADLHAAIASPAVARYERIFLFGYSLGGHVALRYAVDAPDHASPRSRRHALRSISTRRAHAFDRPACELYRRYILRSLYEIYEDVARRRRVPISVALARRIRSIREWDRLIVAPRYGFRDAEHYYHSVSVAPWLPELRMASLLVFARHDRLSPRRPCLRLSRRTRPAPWSDGSSAGATSVFRPSSISASARCSGSRARS